MIPASHSSPVAVTFVAESGDALAVEQRIPDASRVVVLDAETEAWLLDVLLQRSLERGHRPAEGLVPFEEEFGVTEEEADRRSQRPADASPYALPPAPPGHGARTGHGPSD